MPSAAWNSCRQIENKGTKIEKNSKLSFGEEMRLSSNEQASSTCFLRGRRQGVKCPYISLFSSLMPYNPYNSMRK